MTLPAATDLPFEDDDAFMYADHDSPEENARVRALIARSGGAAWAKEIQDKADRGGVWLADCFVTLLIIVIVGIGLYAVDAQPSKMLSMFSGPQVSDVVPTVYAPTGEWKRKP